MAYSGDNFQEPSEHKVSIFNSTLAILIRLDNLWKDTHNHSRSGQLMKWNWDLDRVWCEIVAEASPEEEKEFDSFSSQISLVIKDRERLYKVLSMKERFLRKLQQKQGKGVEHRMSAEEYMSD